jgi:hypothetical protein
MDILLLWFHEDQVFGHDMIITPSAMAALIPPLNLKN